MMAAFSKINKLHKKIAAAFLILILIISIGAPVLFFVPKQADAQLGCASSLITGAVGTVKSAITGSVPVADGGLQLKEGCLDEIAWTIAKIAVQKMTQSLVQWINSGFNGNPAFVSDPAGFFGAIADNVAGQIIEGSSLGFICSPFQVEIRASLALSQQNFQNQVSCSLTGSAANIQAFIDHGITFDVSQTGGSSSSGGRYWDQWWDLTTNANNDPYQVFNTASGALSIALITAQGRAQDELNWGSGFLSWRDCSGQSGSASGSYGNIDQSNCPIATPGSTIVAYLNKQLGAPVDSLVTADEINEIVSALFGQLVSQVFGAAQGLLGTSQSNPNYGGGSYLDALGSDSNSQFTSSRDLSSAGITNNIAIIQGYLATKNQSLALVNASIALQNQIAPACGVNSSQANGASSVISGQLQPLVSGLQTDIATANGYVAGLNNFKAQLAALSPSDTDGFNQILSTYTQYLNQFNLDSMPIMAKSELADLPKTLNPLNQSAQSTFNQCTAATTGGTNGGGTQPAQGGNAGGAQHNQ
jgi:hypothetical protein